MTKFQHIQDLVHRELLRQGLSRRNFASMLGVKPEKVGKFLEKGANPRVKFVIRVLATLGLKWEVVSPILNTPLTQDHHCSFCSSPMQSPVGWLQISVGQDTYRLLCEGCGKYARTHFLMERLPTDRKLTTADVCEPVDSAFESDDEW